MTRPVQTTAIPLHHPLFRGERQLLIALTGLPGGGKSSLFRAVASTAVSSGALAGTGRTYDECAVQVGLDQARVIDLPSVRSLSRAGRPGDTQVPAVGRRAAAGGATRTRGTAGAVRAAGRDHPGGRRHCPRTPPRADPGAEPARPADGNRAQHDGRGAPQGPAHQQPGLEPAARRTGGADRGADGPRHRRAVLRQHIEGECSLHNCYPEVVKPQGNPLARRLLEKSFEVASAAWRGVGDIAGSGYFLKESLQHHDVRNHLPDYAAEQRKRAGAMPPGCDCARVVLGKIYPTECRLYGTACTPRNPVGPCMVSDEGACRIWWAAGTRTL